MLSSHCDWADAEEDCVEYSKMLNFCKMKRKALVGTSLTLSSVQCTEFIIICVTGVPAQSATFVFQRIFSVRKSLLHCALWKCCFGSASHKFRHQTCEQSASRMRFDVRKTFSRPLLETTALEMPHQSRTSQSTAFSQRIAWQSKNMEKIWNVDDLSDQSGSCSN